MCINLKFVSVALTQSKKAGNQEYSETNPIKKLDWNVNDELDLI